jgi:hypothetical protein
MLSHSSTGMPVVDAQEDFLRTAGVPRGQAQLEVIPLKAVVGTVEPTNMFDEDKPR